MPKIGSLPLFMPPVEVCAARLPYPNDTAYTTRARERIASGLHTARRAAQVVVAATTIIGAVGDQSPPVSGISLGVGIFSLCYGLTVYAGAAKTARSLIDSGQAETFSQMLVLPDVPLRGPDPRETPSHTAPELPPGIGPETPPGAAPEAPPTLPDAE